MLKKGNYTALWCAVLILAAAVRLPQLSHRPMHTDEAVHAVKFAELLESGSYRYDSNEYHGPTLNYFTLLPAWLRGQETLTELDETTLRLVPVFFGLLLVLLPLLLQPVIGSRSALASGMWIALSAPQVFYSRYYIHEVLFVFFAMLLVGASMRYFRTRHWAWSVTAGAALGFLHASKETDLLIAAAAAGALATLWLLRRFKPSCPSWSHALLFSGTAFLISSTLFTSFFANPAGIGDSFRTYTTYMARGAGESLHLYPWYYYLQLLFFFKPATNPLISEAWLLPFAAIAILTTLRKGEENDSLRFLVLFMFFLALIFSALPYKTPWNLLVFHYGFLLLAGYGSVRVLQREGRKRRWGVVYLFLALAGIGIQSIWLNYFRDSDPVNPWVYAHPGPDLKRVSDLVESAALSSPHGLDTPVEVVVPGHGYWPLPWTLRRLRQVGWYDQVELQQPPGEIILTVPEAEAALVQKLYVLPQPGEKHLYAGLWHEYAELRPGVEIRGYIRAELKNGINPDLMP